MKHFLSKCTGYEKQFGIFDERIAEIIAKRYLKKGLVLDIGCGYGNLLQAFHKLGYQTIGIDNDIDAERVCKEKGIEFHRRDLDNDKLPFRDKLIDNITCIHLVEHLKDALGFLEDCFRVLKKDGRIVIVCPDCKFFSGYWDPPTHFTPITRIRMEGMLTLTGFKLIESRAFKKPDWLKWIWRYFDFPFFMNRDFFICAAQKGA